MSAQPMASTSSTSGIIVQPRAGGKADVAMESNTVIVVLGASGDLARKKVSPLKINPLDQ